MTGVALELRAESGKSRRRERRQKAAAFVIVVTAILALLAQGERGTGSGTQPPLAATLDIATPQIADTLAGQSSTPISIVVTNSGSSPARNVAVQQNESAAFRTVADRCSGTDIAAGGNCSFDVVFAPPDRGRFTGSWTVRYGDQSRSVALEGNGLLRRLTLPDPVTFSPTSMAAGAVTSVTISNAGDVPIVVQGVAIDPQDAPFTADGCAITTLAAAGGTCSVSVAFVPKAEGASSARLVILGAEGVEEGSVPVSGSTLAQVFGELVADPPGPILLNGDPRYRRVKLTNTGAGPVTFGSETIVYDSPAKDWLTVTNGCKGQSLAAQGGSCEVLLILAQGLPYGQRARVLFDVQGAKSSPFTIEVYTPTPIR
jgi:hypothetical protein